MRAKMLDASRTVAEFLEADFHGETAKAEKLAIALENWNMSFDIPTTMATRNGTVVLTSREELLDLLNKYSA
jgi:hypothetical protein